MSLCTYVNEEGGDGETVHSETPSLMSYTLRYVSFTETVSICRVVFREPMHLCTCVSEKMETIRLLFVYYESMKRNLR
jgi:hypothetical protein